MKCWEAGKDGSQEGGVVLGSSITEPDGNIYFGTSGDLL